MKRIIIVPQKGWMLSHDFSIHRLGKYLKSLKNTETIVIKIDNKKLDGEFDTGNFVDKVINVINEEEIFKTIKELNPDLIFHRSWMLAYPFAAKLVKEFENVVVNIKDWNFSSKEEYEFIFPTYGNDFEAIEDIFKNAKYILSHFTKKQSDIWAKEYNVDKNKFIFFPEYCNENQLLNKTLKYDDVKLVYAGGISPTSLPEQLFPWKSHIRSIHTITQQNINIDFVIPEGHYKNIMLNKNLNLDWLYEDKFNKRMNIVCGKNLSANVLDKYHFGFFELETSGINKELYQYAVVSKFAFYLEAGLPMLVNKDFKVIAEMVMDNKMGIVYSNNQLDDFNNILNISQNEYDEMVKNIYTFRESYTYEANSKTVNEILGI